MKLHKDCLDKGLSPCKVSYDPTTAKEMLLMATSLEEQQFWVGRLLKKIQKGGYKAAGQVCVCSVVQIFSLSMITSLTSDLVPLLSCSREKVI